MKRLNNLNICAQHMSIDLTLQKYFLYLELEALQPQPQLSYCFSPERIYRLIALFQLIHSQNPRRSMNFTISALYIEFFSLNFHSTSRLLCSFSFCTKQIVQPLLHMYILMS